MAKVYKRKYQSYDIDSGTAFKKQMREFYNNAPIEHVLHRLKAVNHKLILGNGEVIGFVYPKGKNWLGEK